MTRGHRILGIVLGTIVGIVGIVLIGALVLSNTEYGRERVRRIAQSAIQGAANHGVVRLGHISGNLLSGFTIADVSIRDSAGRPFVVADSVRLDYGLRALMLKRIELQNLRLVRPLVVLDRPPGDSATWNYKAIFASDTPKAERDTTRMHFGDWIVLHDITVVDGRIVIRSPWKPKSEYTGARRDSAIARALAGQERVVVERRDGGFQKVVEFQKLNGELPYLRLKHPDTHVRRLEVAHLSVVALPFHPPAAVVNDFVGALDFTGDSIWFRDAKVRMPGSLAAGDGRYGFVNDNFDLTLRAQPVAFDDIRWIMPWAPSRGGGTTDFRLRWRGDTTTYIAQRADVRVDSAHVNGDFGITLLGDSLWFHDTALRFASVDTHLIEQLFPAVTIPRHGTLAGNAKLDGPPGLMQVDGDVVFDDAQFGRNHVVAVGGIGTTGHGVRFRDLDVTLDPVQVAMARTFAPRLPLDGVLRGSARVNGATDARVMVRADLTHLDAGARSRVSGNAAVDLAGTPAVDADLHLLPLSLTEVGRFAPAIGLRGIAAGPVRVSGPLGNLTVDARLAIVDGGRLDVRGTLDLASAEKGYDLATRMRLFNAHSVVARAPATSLTATAFARGRGFSPPTMNAAFGANLASSTIDTVAVDSAYVRARIARGLLQVDSTTVSGPHTRVTLGGDFGVAAGRTGTLRYVAVVDSLQAINRFLPPPDTSTVAPRPRGYSRIVARAQADSAAVARATEIERLATGAEAPRLGPVPPPPRPIRVDSVAGAVRAAGTIRGGIDRFDVRGRAGAERVVLRGNSLRRAQLEYAWLNARTPRSAIAVGGSLDSLRAAGFAFDSVAIRGSYHGRMGDAALVVYQQTGEEYSAGGDFVLHTGHSELHLRSMALRFDSTRWTAPHPSAIRWGANGIVLDHVELTNGNDGRIFANGEIPSEGAGALDVAIENFQAADLAALTQSDLDFRGLITMTARVEGTTGAPRIRGALGVTDAMYGNASVPDVRATARYAAPAATFHIIASEGARELAVGDGTIPMNIGGPAGAPLLPDAPITVDLRADGLPLDLVSRFTDAVSDVRGRAYGVVRMRGTTRNPDVVGALAVQNGAARITATGMQLVGVHGSIRMVGDTVIIDSIAGNSGGRVYVRGGLGVRQLTAPSFDLHVQADNARVLDDDRGSVRADVDVAVSGPFDRTEVSGRVAVLNGVIVVPESDHKRVISARDPTLYEVVDTATVDETEAALVEPSPLVSNLRMNVNVSVARDTWVRTKDANVEIYTPPDRGLAVRMDNRRRALVLDGEVATDRGEYEFLSKRFQIRRGSAVFVGEPDPDPNLQITGEYEVRLAASQAINIRVQIGGTLSSPRIALDSDAQPPLSQSDLLSYLAFGRSSSSLLQFEGSSLGGGGGANNLAGAGAQLATQQLAAVALGVFVDDLEGQAAQSLGAAYVNVTPADLYTELARSGEISGFFKGTEVEVGKYTDPNTFVALQARLSTFASNPQDRAVPGVRVQRRLGKGFTLDASFGPRYIPQPPTLNQVSPKSTGVFGTFLSREWKF